MMLQSAIDIASRFSLFVRQQLERYPDLLCEADSASLTLDQMREQARHSLSWAQTDEQMMQALRQYRRKQMVRMAVRDLAGLASVEETLADASAMGDVLVGLAYDWAYRQQSAKWGEPIGEHSATAQTLIILGMGKLGGRELNYSSDIDLIFVFPEKGFTNSETKSITNDEFFTKVGQQVNQLLNNTTADGFVFRVDMMLRPFGSSGQLVHSFDAFEQYYQLHGRPWERYAMIKARAMTGKPADIAELESMMRPFIYRRYVDFTMLASLRDLKRMIALDVLKKGADRDVKLGDGGIREVEFIVQAFQLVHGGQDARLRGRSLLPMLQTLAERQYLAVEEMERLKTAYLFLRAVENRLQMWADQQTHLLPTDSDRLQLLAESMQFDTVDAFMTQLNQHRYWVSQQFEAVLGVEVVDEQTGWLSVWQAPEVAPFPQSIIAEAEWRTLLTDMTQSRKVAVLSNDARDRLTAVMPLILAELAAHAPESEALKRVLSVIQAVLNRSAYLVLLRESQTARAQLVQLCAASPWLTRYLVEQPALLDQLLDERQLYAPLSKSALQEELAHQCVDVDDEERFMEVLRRFKHAQVFRVAASDLMGKLPLMKVSDYLTWIAEAIVEQALQRAWQVLVAKHGLPAGMRSADIPMIVVGFGKLGGLELGYGSDLDMVYMSDPALDPQAMTDGFRPLDNTVLMARLGQKLSSLLSTNVMSGIAYEVDMQLRPHGASGALVPTLASFFRYEREQAWIWEHQALIRTRAIAGDPVLMAQFEQERIDFLTQARDEATLKEAVLSMRLKMRAHLDKSSAEFMDIKQGEGGMIDIEFLVQYWVLLHAHQSPDVVRYSDNIRQVEGLVAAGVLDAETGEALMSAYRFYRHLGHQYALAEKKLEAVPIEQVGAYRTQVMALWQRVFA